MKPFCRKLAMVLALIQFSLLVLLSGQASAIEPRLIENLTVKITQSGYFDVDGTISEVNLTVFIPQEAIKEIEITPGGWEYIYDEYGNKKVAFHFINPTGRVSYRISSVVESAAKHTFEESDIGEDGTYLEETDTVRITPELEELAFQYEKSLKGAAEMTAFVHFYVTYDESLAGEVKPSDWVFENKRGVCVEYANMLAAMLRSREIPTRYVSGWVYSEANRTFIGHAWVEALAENGWVPFDPTALMGGHLDATHIKSSHSPFSRSTEQLRYKGYGGVKWSRNSEQFEIISADSSAGRSGQLRMSLGSGAFAPNSYGYVMANLFSGECRLEKLYLSPCVDKSGKPLVDVLDSERVLWICRRDEQDFVFRIGGVDTAYKYTCPLNLYNIYGQKETVSMEISEDTPEPSSLSIDGPESVGAWEEFSLEARGAENEFIFFSPNLTRNLGREWKLSLRRPGEYIFYLYSGGSLAEKAVSVVMEEEFNVFVSVPSNATQNETFAVAARIQNVRDEVVKGMLEIKVDRRPVHSEEVSFLPKATRDFERNITIEGAGMHRVSASVTASGIYTAGQDILISEKAGQGGLWDAVIGFFRGVFNAIGSFFRVLGGG